MAVTSIIGQTHRHVTDDAPAKPRQKLTKLKTKIWSQTPVAT